MDNCLLLTGMEAVLNYRKRRIQEIKKEDRKTKKDKRIKDGGGETAVQ
jgi:hypothetical protein